MISGRTLTLAALGLAPALAGRAARASLAEPLDPPRGAVHAGRRDGFGRAHTCRPPLGALGPAGGHREPPQRVGPGAVVDVAAHDVNGREQRIEHLRLADPRAA